MSNNSKFDLLKDVDTNVQFALPDLHQLHVERNNRNELFFTKLDHFYHIDSSSEHSSRNTAATKIQKVFRGYRGRKKYLDILYDSVVEGENQLFKQQEIQVKEGEILIESYQIEQEIEDTDSVSRNKLRLAHANAATIQRAWRASRNLHHEHVCCTCNDDFPDLYEYYSETKTVCFCCEEHRHLTNQERLDLFLDTDYVSKDTAMINNDWSNIDSLLNGKNTSIDDNSNLLEDCNGNTNSFSKNTLILSENASKLKFVMVESCTTVHKVFNLNELLETIKEVKVNSDVCSNVSIYELKFVIKELQRLVSERNIELLKELMLRDDLFTRHESLLYESECLAKKEQQRRK